MEEKQREAVTTIQVGTAKPMWNFSTQFIFKKGKNREGERGRGEEEEGERDSLLDRSC